MHRRLTAIATAAVLSFPALAGAQEMNPNVQARQQLMDLYAYNLGVLGGMAQGRVEYDAELASAAATSLYHLSNSGYAAMWPEGTAAGETEGTRALPAIWENMEGFGEGFAALRTASEGMMDAAGTDLASLQAALGPVGQSCGSCHRTFRQSE